MAKPAHRSYSRYAREAAKLLGLMIHNARVERELTVADVAERAGVFGALDELMARYASYEDLTEIIRHRFTSPKATLHELFGRLVFNILCGNTDDDARNHAGFWDGKHLT